MRVERNFIPQTGGRRGFTAIELTAVASIIAILALILVPIVRNRLESVRKTAAQDDMRGLAVAQTIANADTGQYYRLNDLDNAAADLDVYNLATSTAIEKAGAVRTIPNCTWNRLLNSSEVATSAQLGSIAARWNGPYITFNKTKYLQAASLKSLASTRVVEIRAGIATTISANEGPVPILQDPNAPAANSPAVDNPYNDDEKNGELFPVDPWGGPYIFFSSGRFGANLGLTFLNNAASGLTESNFGSSVIYSTGPDGLPGGSNPAAGAYFREAGVLGTGDDESYVF